MVVPTVSPDVAKAIDSSVQNLTLDKVLYATIALVLCVVIGQVLLRLLNRALKVSRIERSLHTFLKSIVRIVIYVVTILLVADALGFPVTTLVAMLGVAGLAVTLAVQDSLSNLAGGILVLTAKPFVVGDVIEVLGTGGTVSDIGLFYTKIATADGKTAFLPNRMLSSAQMTNHTAAGKRRLDVSVILPTGLKEDDVRSALISLTEEDERVLSADPPHVRVVSRKPGQTEYSLRAWVKPGQYWAVYGDWVERAGGVLSARFGDGVMGTLSMQINSNPSIGDKPA